MHELPPVTAQQVRRFHRLLWLPFWFAAFLSAITLVGSMLGSWSATTPAFLCFLPMAFFFVCQMQLALSARLWTLEQRVQRGEAGPTDGAQGSAQGGAQT